MNLNLTHKLSAIICAICGLTFLPLTVTAQNAIITTSTTETGTSYHDVENYSALDVRGNGVVYTGTNITLTGNINTLTLQNGATLSSDNENGGLLLNGALITVTTEQLTLSDGTIIDYNGESPLTLTGNLTIGTNILVDFSNLTETGNYTLLDWSGATVTGDITDAQFNIATTGVEGTFTVNTENKQLTFNATAIPEPSTCFLLGTGLGILLITAHRRRRNAQS